MERLYRRNNNGNISYWQANLDKDDYDNDIISVKHGIIGGQEIISEIAVTQKNPFNEINSRYKEKRKSGYLALDEIKDDNLNGVSIRPPVEDGDAIKHYLETYLPTNLSNTSTNAILPMLAKTYNGNIWKKTSMCAAQWKINGLRCIISPYLTKDLFKPWRLKFQSREGIYWNSLSNIEDYMLHHIDENVWKFMYDNNIAFDGELYIPGKSVNEINHAVKTANCIENKLLQYWTYDICVEDVIADKRNDLRISLSNDFSILHITNYNDHLNNKQRLVYVPNDYCHDDFTAVKLRNKYIGLGFEGLILRNINADYQFGRRRANYMEKFKSATDGKFKIIAIDKEQKRNLPIFTCQNDVNDATFECGLNGTFTEQKNILDNKDKYIGKYMFIEFGERSGISKVPFHRKNTYIIDE